MLAHMVADASPSTASHLRRHWALLRADAARWVVPQAVSPVELVTPALLARLLYRHPPLRAMAWLRLAAALRKIGVPGVSGWAQRRLLRLYGLEIAPNQDIDGGLYIAHPVGCVLMAEHIGANVTVISSVTFGTRDDARWPVIGDGVFVGVGARLLGGITIGDGARIGANAVVLQDVPAGCTAIGIPAAVRPPR